MTTRPSIPELMQDLSEAERQKPAEALKADRLVKRSTVIEECINHLQAQPYANLDHGGSIRALKELLSGG